VQAAQAALPAALLAAQAALLAHGVFDAVVWGQVRTAPVVWGLWGLAAAGINLIYQDCKPETENDSVK
jgi:putative inorganic carbon (HCO3(-)) transporter